MPGERIAVAYLDEPPFFAPTASGEPVGCDIELVHDVVRELATAPVEWHLVTFEELIPGLRGGRWHVSCPMFVTAERAEVVDFSPPVWHAGDGFIVRSDDRRDFGSYEAIASDPSIVVAAVEGQQQVRTAAAAGIEPERIRTFAGQEEAVAAVRGGAADAAVSTAPGNAAYVARLGDPMLRSTVDATGDDGLPPQARSPSASITPLSETPSARRSSRTGAARPGARASRRSD